MAFCKWKRGLSSALDNTSVEDGTLRFTTDNSKLYVDDGQTRKVINPNPDWNASSGNASILNKPSRLSDFENDLGVNGVMECKDIIVDSVTATQDYGEYSYVYSFVWIGMTANTYVYGFLPDFNYSKKQAVNSASGYVNILFEDEPTTPITVRVYAFDPTVQDGMSLHNYVITSVAPSNTYPEFPYVFHANLNGVTSTSYIDIEMLTNIGSIFYAVESVTNGINVYFSNEPSSFPVNVNVYVYTNIINTTISEELLYFTHTITSVTFSNTYPLYSYKCTIPYSGVDASTKVDANIDYNDYPGNYGIESGTNTLTIYFSTQPTLPLTAKVWLQKATSLVQL